jgi:hypothetical protein
MSCGCEPESRAFLSRRAEALILSQALGLIGEAHAARDL